MAVLIGSGALCERVSRFSRCGDFDVICGKDEFDMWVGGLSGVEAVENGGKILVVGLGKKVEVEFDDLESNRWLLDRSYDRCIDVFGLNCWVADLGVLCALKHSHRYHCQHWHKNIRDYSFLKSRVVLDDELLWFSGVRNSEKSKSCVTRSLGVSNDEFFGASQGVVKRLYVHDDLHYATCFYGEPLWARCKVDLSKAAVSEKLFGLLSFEDRVRMVQEEAFVIALERKIIPFGVEANEAFRWAVMRIGTSLTGGWFREFTVENYNSIIKYDWDFVGKFEVALLNGKINKVIC